MQLIIATIKTGDTGVAVANLQDTLLALLDKQVIQDTPNRPTPEELKELTKQLKKEREESRFDEATRQLIFYFQLQHDLGDNFQGVVEEKTAEKLNAFLKELRLLDQPEWLIRGQVIKTTALANVLVRVFDRDLLSRQLLGEAITDQNGFFAISYKTAEFSAGDQAKEEIIFPDLVFELALDGQALEKFQIQRLPDNQLLTDTSVVSDDDLIMGFQARKLEDVRIVLIDSPQKQLTEFERLLWSIEKLLPELVNSDAAELLREERIGGAVFNFDEALRRDVSFTVRETGFSNDQILNFQHAFKQSHQFESVPAWAFYGLASENLSLDTVFSLSNDALIEALKRWQPSYHQEDLEIVAKSLKQLINQKRIEGDVAALKNNVGDLLQPILASEEKLNGFLDAYARHEGDVENFWKSMGENPEYKEIIPKIQLNLQLSQLTLNNKGLTNALQQIGINSTRQLVDITEERWEALALEHRAEIPIHISGESDVAKAKIYAKELQTLVEVTFPTEFIKKNIQQPEVKAFLDNNADFDFTTMPVESYLHEKGESAFNGISETEAVKNNLREIQRLYTVTANAADMNVLREVGYSSAHQIAKLPLDDFLRNVNGKITPENAEVYHAKALAVSDASTMFYQQFRGLVVSQNFNANNAGQPSPNLLPGIPDWETLFGSLDTCECQHCRSVYSPAAYFVDLLHVLLGQNNGAPRKEIFRRRPDLKYTKLTCEHTETLIPYIDLVNEVLETYAAQSDIGNSKADDHAKESVNNTSGFSAADLASNPQHPNPKSNDDADKAYGLLKSAIYPLNLPFDMNLEVARQFLLEQHSDRFKVLNTFGIASELAIAAERLGLSTRQFEIVTLKRTDGVTNARVADNSRDIDTNDLWGSPSIPLGSSLGKELANVKVFLDSADLSYKELIELLQTKFLNENFPINLFLQDLTKLDRTAWLAAHPTEDSLALKVIELGGNPEAPCDLVKTSITHLDGSFLSDDELSKFNRFIRLWKILGCSIHELDNLLTANSATDITTEAIKNLSILWQVQHDFDLPFEKVSVFIGNIPTAGKDSLYSRIFLNNAILQIDDKFALNVNQNELANSSEFLKDHIPAILAAFQISEEHFNQLATYVNLDTTVDTLTLKNLSAIYRYVLLAKGLRLKISDLLTWLELIKQPPWTSIIELTNTKEQLEKFKSYGIKATDFAYIFNDVTVAGSMLPPKDEIITQSTKTLREGLQKVSQENNPQGGIVTVDFLKNRLGVLFDAEEVSRIVGILDGTNTEDSFNYLMTPKVSEAYKSILDKYLTALDVADLSSTAEVNDRFAKFWKKIEIKLLPVLRKTFVQQDIAATFKVDAALASYFLSETLVMQTCLDTEVDTPTHNKAYAELYILLNKCVWLISKFNLSAKELSFFQNNSDFDTFDWKAFAIKAWLHIANYVTLRNLLPIAEKDLLFVFNTAKDGGDISQVIVDISAWDKQNVDHFVKKHAPADFFNEAALSVLQKQNALSQKIGVSIEKLESWATDVIGKDHAQDIKRTLKTKYDETAWVEVSTRVHNRIRNVLRDALVAFLLQKPEIKGLGLKDANDLYGYFLIDVEMDACMQTSRLKQAIASVQLFVQRCLLNLEAPTVLPGQTDANQWQWMKNYRVWEANRKVFLYPENWIEPELRDNKSPFFKDLESELLQGEVTNDSVEKALMNYLEKLHDVARLDICGCYEDTEAQELHVFGRTFNSPAQYFYRKLDLSTQVWTAWERVQLDIQGNEEGESAGVHLIPVVWNRRLYLFWPIFTVKTDKEKQQQENEEHRQQEKEKQRDNKKKIQDWNEKYSTLAQVTEQRKREIETQRADSIKFFSINGFGTNATINFSSGATTTEIKVSSFADVNKVYDDMIAALPKIPPKPEPYESEPFDDKSNWSFYEVKLAWSEYKNKKWSNKRVSQSFIRTPSDRFAVAASYIYRFAVKFETNLIVQLFYNPVMQFPVGEFQINCNSKVSVIENDFTPLEIEVIHPKQVNFYQSHLSATNTGRSIYWHEKDSFPLVLINKKSKESEILSGSEQEYKVLFPADHNFSYNTMSRFFYQDKRRNYYVDYTGIWFFHFIPGLMDSNKVTIPKIAYEKVPKKFLARQSDTTDRFNLEAATSLRNMVDSGHISSSTNLQIRSMQSLKVSEFAKVKPDIVSFLPSTIGPVYFPPSRSKPQLQFKPFFHAYICKFMDALNKEGIQGILNLYNQQLTDLQFTFSPGGIAGMPIPTGITNNFVSIYRPNQENVDTPYPNEDVDFSPSGAYSLYNWELFFHIPMLLANRLSKNLRYEEAVRWYHFCFFPTTIENLNSSARFWQVIPLRNTPKETLEELFNQLKKPANDPRRKELETAISAWRKNPFNPHLIARMRLIAYQKNAVMKYLDNLIAWADNLFRQDTIESINEATQLYLLAAELLGKRPEKIPVRGKIQAFNYAELEANGLDAFSNTVVKFETLFPFYNLESIPKGENGAAAILNSTATSFYFCLPENEKLLGCWDTVADRLFKIRHCQNIEGVERQLALFEPPIDPALLVQAVAGGVDISSILADLNAPLPHYRFNYILQRALEISSELQSLGNSLLSALEKKDAESLTLMRTQQETSLLNLAKLVRKLQVTEAQRNREGLEKTREVTEIRKDYYSQLVKGGLNSSEKEHQLLGFASMALSVTGQFFEMAASSAQPIPDTEVGAIAGPAGGATNNNRVAGGDKTAKALSAFGRFFNMLSTMSRYGAESAQTNAGYQRREAEWKYQQELATKELSQIDIQILVSQIREEIADQELTNHEQQIENAQQIEEFYRNKFTQEELYGWMVGEISTIYFQCYQLAYDLAKKAEKTYRYELGLPASNFVQFGIWDSFRKGLMSGERLYLSLKQMEKSYLDQNRREYEITKNISLIFHDPMALITFKETGSCMLELTEPLFDMDYPGHYMRRIKNVSVTIPCIVGPYTSISCTLTLLSSEIRVKSTPQSPYPKQLGDTRFEQNFAAMQSIATSTAQNDTGLFELNFRDERYLPFEGCGVISRWKLELPNQIRQFNYQTISDVILRINYTARPGGKNLQKEAEKNLTQLLKDESNITQSRLFSLRHEFSSEWYKLLDIADAAGDHIQAFLIDKQRFPFVFKAGTITAKKIDLFGSPKTTSETPTFDKLSLFSPSGQVSLIGGSPVGNLVHRTSLVDIEIKDIGVNQNEVEWKIQVKKADIKNCLEKLDDIFIVIEYIVDF